MPLVMLANDEQVLVYKMDNSRYAWIGAEDGFTRLENPPTFGGGEFLGAATEHGFILGRGTFIGPDDNYATADGSQWTRIDGALSKYQNQAVGPTLLMPTGAYSFTPDADGGGGSGGFSADGGWIIGITRP